MKGQAGLWAIHKYKVANQNEWDETDEWAMEAKDKVSGKIKFKGKRWERETHKKDKKWVAWDKQEY